MYPTQSSFLESVSLEVKQQVRRLQHHPSLIIWAGNNENEAALRGNWYYASGSPRTVIISFKAIDAPMRYVCYYIKYSFIL
jgi:beta-galactosidase/beta-glucuronidase